MPALRPVQLSAVKATQFCVGMMLRVTLIVGFVLAMGFGALHARLAHSPISMGFLVPSFEKAVNRTLSGLHFEIGDAVLRRSGSWLGVEFRLKNVRLLDNETGPVVESPFASANVSLPGLLTGTLAAGHVDLIGPRLYLQYSNERGLALSFTNPQHSKDGLSGGARRTLEPEISGATTPQSEAASTEQGVIRQARGRAVSLTNAMTDLFAKTRQGQSAYLNSFGIKDAFVYFDQGEQITRWSVPDAAIYVRHSGDDSAVEGRISVQSPSEAFDLTFRAEQDRPSGQLALSVNVEDMVPRAFSSDFPAFRLPAMWNMPISLAAKLTLGGNGDILGAQIHAEMKGGEFYAPWAPYHPAIVDEGYLDLSYSREQGLIQLADSSLRWGDSRIQLSGVLQRQRQTGLWAFLFNADELKLGAQRFGIPVIPLDKLQAQGRYNPQRGGISLDRLLIQAADAYISLAGNIVQGERSPAVRLKGEISQMPLAFFKLIWPKFVAHGARDWIGTRIPSGRITGGTVNIDIAAEQLASLERDGTLPPEAVDFKVALEDLKIHYVMGLPPLHVRRGKARVAGQRFFFNAPDATVVAPSGESIHFSDGQFIVGDMRPHIPQGEIHFKSTAGAAAVLSLLDHPKLNYVSALKMPLPKLGGTVESTFSIAMPMKHGLKFPDIKLNGRSEVRGVQAANLPGGFDATGGSVKFDVTETAIQANGEVKINDLPVLVAWQRIFKAPPERQPQLRLRTVLDQKARKALGFSADHIIRGGTPAEMTVNFRRDQLPRMHFELNLTEADLILASLGWRKPPGRRAVLNFDLTPRDDSGFDVANIDMRGDDLAVKGVLRLNENRKPIAFNLPVVSLNMQTQLAIDGRLGGDNIWKIRLDGRSYDGRRFFRSLFSAGQLVENQPKPPKASPGVDIEAQIETVNGFFDTRLNNVTIAARRRNNKLVDLDLHGKLNGREPLAARIQSQQNGQRQILAEAANAGAAFRLVGFYPLARGGQVSLKVNLDGRGAQQKTGILYASDFQITNDQVVKEVLSRSGEPTRDDARRPQFDQLRFDRMRVPFSVGNGQFILHDAAINGPSLGATLRGPIDFNKEQMNLSGTFVPLYGINGALGFVPVLGQLLVSRPGEGVFGITFAVRGSLANPNVEVNPMSLMLPGFLRQIFEFDQNQPQIIQQDQRRRRKNSAATNQFQPATQ